MQWQTKVIREEKVGKAVVKLEQYSNDKSEEKIILLSIKGSYSRKSNTYCFAINPKEGIINHSFENGFDSLSIRTKAGANKYINTMKKIIYFNYYKESFEKGFSYINSWNFEGINSEVIVVYKEGNSTAFWSEDGENLNMSSVSFFSNKIDVYKRIQETYSSLRDNEVNKLLDKIQQVRKEFDLKINGIKDKIDSEIFSVHQ